MKKILLGLVAGLCCLTAAAIPADPTPVKVTQPDGTSLTVSLHGDEFFHFTTTADGYTIVKNDNGYYTYARLDGDRLVAGDRIARDAASRTAAERAYLSTIPKGLTSPRQIAGATQMLGRRNAAMRRVGAEGQMDYENFRGLIILINYRDKKFTMSNANSFYNDMVNTHDFTGYTLNNRRVNMTGSVRDYFYDNSNHIFDPVFDIVGPVDVNYSCTDPGGTDDTAPIFHAALAAIDDDIDFSKYDMDDDGIVDMVFFLVAGYSANYSGNNDNYLWPHMYWLYGAPERDNMRFGLYACSTEIAGWEGYYADVNGIGTICHEFGHVLGLPDLYDTDYNGSGGESRHPGEWSVMASGSGNNFGRNPVGYSLYERYALGFTTPTLLEKGGNYELQPLDESNRGYRLNTPTRNEYFLIENRQPGKWDRYLPGHGMLVVRVDSTDEHIWRGNTVNANPNRMYYELLRAQYNGTDSESDPFPGSAGITTISNFTDPNLMTWNGGFNDFFISNIAENGSLVTFSLQSDTTILNIIEDFENMPVTTDLAAQGVQGVFSKWDFSKSAVAAPGSGNCNGERAVAMKRPSMIRTSAPLNIIPLAVNFTVYNPTSTAANFRVYYSTDNGESWSEPNNNTLTASAKGTSALTVNLPTDKPLMLRINQTSGSATASCYLDDIKFYYVDTWGPIKVDGDVNGDGEINIADVNALIDCILSSVPMDNGDVNGDGEINIADVNYIIDLILNNP